jgi:dethiobiotin synthetase
MQPFFVTSSGTEIGKTLVTTTLCWQLKRAGKNVTALKPVISGYDPKDKQSDTALILQSLGVPPSPQVMEFISPWRYALPLAPAMAAAKEGNAVDLQKLIAFCREHAEMANDFLLIEGVGGVMAPLNDTATMLDWMRALKWPAFLVAGTYLGSLSHTLTAYEVLKNRGIPVRALVLSESERSSVSLDDTAKALEKFLPASIPVVKLPRIAAREEMWKHLPSISWICDA